MKEASLVGSDGRIFQKAKLLIESNRYRLRDVLINTVDYERLRKSEAVFLDASLKKDLKKEILLFCLKNGKKVFLIPEMTDVCIRKKDLKCNDLMLHEAGPLRLNIFQRFLKRAFDFTFSLTAIILLFPLMAFIFILIKALDGGPAVYRQKRLTLDKREFLLFKFRTMVKNAERRSGAALVHAGDERITRIGRILRKTRLDELLQLFNVLIGDMSIVGPRPERRCFVERFEEENPFYKFRFQVKAGITGLAQIHCHYGSHYEDKLRYDLAYIAEYSFWLDLKIIFLTIPVFFRRKHPEVREDEDFLAFLDGRGQKIFEVSPGIYELRDLHEKNHLELQ